jgi:hypothetical protein
VDAPSDVLAVILTRGHFDVAVSYSSGRVLPVDLDSFVSDNAVRLRGWPVPYIDYQTQKLRHGSWIAQDVSEEAARAHARKRGACSAAGSSYTPASWPPTCRTRPR